MSNPNSCPSNGLSSLNFLDITGTSGTGERLTGFADMLGLAPPRTSREVLDLA
jgi:hypothetical protein